MSRFRTPLIALGIIGAVVVAVAVVLVVQIGRGTAVELAVALTDVPAGAMVSRDDFRRTEVYGLDTTGYVTADEFLGYVGYPLLEPVHAGFPLGKAQVATTDTLRFQTRLTLLLEDPSHLVYPLSVTPEQAGNYVTAGDYVDVIFTLGRVAAAQLQHTYGTGEEDVPGASAPITPTVKERQVGEIITTTLTMPLVKVILPNVPVLQVEREQVRAASATYGVGESEAPSQTTVQGDVQRLYLELDQEQAEILSFAVHNGVLNLPARARPAGEATEGFTWEDFVELFFRDRPAPWEEQNE